MVTGNLMRFNRRDNPIAGGVFLIGLGLLFATGAWWPGILYVLGASAITQGVVERGNRSAIIGGLWMIGIGMLFGFGFSLPLLLVGIGAVLILSALTQQGVFTNMLNPRHEFRPDGDMSEKIKNDADFPIKRKNDDLIINEEGEYMTPEEVQKQHDSKYI
jgi:hypothetical protein